MYRPENINNTSVRDRQRELFFIHSNTRHVTLQSSHSSVLTFGFKQCFKQDTVRVKQCNYVVSVNQEGRDSVDVTALLTTNWSPSPKCDTRELFGN